MAQPEIEVAEETKKVASSFSLNLCGFFFLNGDLTVGFLLHFSETSFFFFSIIKIGSLAFLFFFLSEMGKYHASL